MEKLEPKTSHTERPVSFTNDDFKDLPTFQKAAEREVGDNPHKDHINFSELDEQDMLWAERYSLDMIEVDELREATEYARRNRLVSSQAFRGWLGGFATVQIRNRKIKE